MIMMMDDITPEQQAQMEQEQARIAMLDGFGQTLAGLRDDAVSGRAETGIEQTWDEDDEFYDGIDEANRTERATKPASTNGRVITVDKGRQPTRSTVFVNITQPFCDMAAARVADMLLPADDMPFGIQATPVPDLAAIVESGDDTMMQHPDGTQATAAEVAQGRIQEAEEGAEKAQTQIWDWLVESQWHAEVRMVIEDAARIGTGVLKGPFPVKRRHTAAQIGAEGFTLRMVEEIKPQSRRIDPRNLFPDPACGDSIHNGSYIWERDSVTAKQLADLKGITDEQGQPYYIDSQIDAVLKEGPGKKYEADKAGKESRAEKDRYEIWYYHGIVGRDQLQAAGCDCEEGEQIPAIATMVNDRVIKAALNPLDSGSFPYDVMPWQARAGTWMGTGVSRQIRTPQRMLNAATRNMMDNAGFSKPILAVRQGILTPADGVWEITGGKLFLVDEHADAGKVADAIHSIIIPSQQVELMNIIRYALEMAERVTSMPIMLQGQQGGTPETAEGRRLLQNNAGAVLRRIAKLFDDKITEPHITRYYEWLLLHGDDPSAKGDYVVDSRGSSALFERDSQGVFIAQMGNLATNPAFGIDPKKWAIEMLKGQKLDPERFKYSDEEVRQLQSQPQAVAPQIEAAKIRAEAQVQTAQIKAQTDVAATQADTDRDTVYVNAQAERDRNQAEYNMQKLIIEREIALLKYANDRSIALDKVKSELARTTMELQTQKELAALSGKIPQVAHAAMEPVGRAEDGRAFEQ